MKAMKKRIAALIVLALALALTGAALTLTGAAMAACQFGLGDHLKFVRNTHVYSGPRERNKTDTVIHRGSWARVICTRGSRWVKMQLNYLDESKTGWFRVGDLKLISDPKKYWTEVNFKNPQGEVIADFGKVDIYVVYSKLGKGMSSETAHYYIDDVTPDCYDRVKADATVWMHRVAALEKKYVPALHRGDTVKYRFRVGIDTRGIWFYGVRYGGRDLWVSAQYSHLIRK